MRKTFRYRLYPNKAQEQVLEQQLREGCKLYNAALQERRDACSRASRSPTTTKPTSSKKSVPKD